MTAKIVPQNEIILQAAREAHRLACQARDAFAREVLDAAWAASPDEMAYEDCATLEALWSPLVEAAEAARENWAQARGVPTIKKKRVSAQTKWTDERLGMMQNLLGAGLTRRQTAAALGVTVKALDRAKVRLRQRLRAESEARALTVN